MRTLWFGACAATSGLHTGPMDVKTQIAVSIGIGQSQVIAATFYTELGAGMYLC